MKFQKLIDKFQNGASADERCQAATELASNEMLNEISIKAFASGLLDSNDGVRDICQRALCQMLRMN